MLHGHNSVTVHAASIINAFPICKSSWRVSWQSTSRSDVADVRVKERMAILQKWVPYSQRYLFNAIPDTNRNANPTNPNRYIKGNPNPTNPNTGTVVNKAPTSAG